MKKFLIALFKDLVDQAWTLLGMAIAWLVLEGSARDLTGLLIGITLLVWIVTFPLRYEKEEEPAPAKKKPLRKAAFKPKAKDGDGDGLVQEGTIWERKVSKKK
jgi:hypothetical protein